MSLPKTNNCVRAAVISDVHGNAAAYRSALRLAHECGFDQLIILGDLLTYGCEPVEVLDLTIDAVARSGALLIKGNHDQLYFDLARNDLTYYSTLPNWLRETIDWTLEAIKGNELESMFRWWESYECAYVFFAHANPFEYGDWTYLTGSREHAGAASALCQMRKRVGVFGHTHRPALVEAEVMAGSDAGPTVRRLPAAAASFSVAAHRQVAIVNAGSVGQPRSRPSASQMLFLSWDQETVSIEFAAVRYDIAAHRRALADAPLSQGTRMKLLSYFS